MSHDFSPIEIFYQQDVHLNEVAQLIQDALMNECTSAIRASRTDDVQDLTGIWTDISKPMLDMDEQESLEYLKSDATQKLLSPNRLELLRKAIGASVDLGVLPDDEPHIHPLLLKIQQCLL